MNKDDIAEPFVVYNLRANERFWELRLRRNLMLSSSPVPASTISSPILIPKYMGEWWTYN